MGSNRDRADSRSTAAVRDTESFMKIEVAGIDAKFARTADADEGVEVGAIHIDLAPCLVDFLADISNRRFKDPVGGWVRDHGGGDAGTVLLKFGIEVSEVDVALVVAGDCNDSKTDENGTRGIGPVGGNGDETDIAMGFTSRLVPSADREKSGIFALGPGIGLKRDVGKTRDFA